MFERKDVFILGLRQQVIFPAIRTSVMIQSKAFEELCEFCEKHDDTHVGVVALKPSSNSGDEIFDVGTYCKIASHSQSVTKVGNEDVKLVTLSIEGQSRFRLKKLTQTSPYRLATIQVLDEQDGPDKDPAVKNLVSNLQQFVMELVKEPNTQEGQGGNNVSNLLKNLFGGKRIRWPSSPSVMADMIAAGLSQLSILERQKVLETVSVKQRLELVLELVNKVVEVQRVSKEINSNIQKRSEDELRETVLKRQLQELQREMKKLKSGGAETETVSEDADEGDDEEDDASVLRESLKKAGLSDDAKTIALRELRRLQNIQPHHPEYTVCRTYLETLASLPWQLSTQDDIDLKEAHQILEKDHHGLETVKRRILEFLAVQKMRGDMKGPILCLHGPPGVGKTSLGRSIAKALGRKFHRIALGGVRDESELRGHRRTYIGSMPGAIIQALISMKVNNPVILLDEIDKLTRNAMFNPSGALLELLDPEQNFTFKDHYVNTPFDLSKALFLCTCNELNTIDRPLLDRMEVIDLSGYTVEEKLHISMTHLLPKQRKLHALEAPDPEPQVAENDSQGQNAASDKLPAQDPQESQSATSADVPSDEGVADKPQKPEQPLLTMTKSAIADLITKWTMESGVRSLERRIAQVCRWAALRLTNPDSEAMVGDSEESKEADRLADEALKSCGPDAEGRLQVDAHHLAHIVGVEMFEPDLAERLTVGVSMGLGVTATGGQLLFVEAARNKGAGKLTVTGQLGDVMRESVSTAMSLLRSKIYYASLAASKDGRQVVGPDVSSSLPLTTDPQSVDSTAKFQDIIQQLLSRSQGTKDLFTNDDVHVHFPAGAIPKDGPSAGVATTLALASLLLDKPVRSDTAVTGEISLRGHVLPVGGIRDKVLAAHRAGVRHVLLPFANQRHVKDEIPVSAMGDIEIHYLKHIDEALAWVFVENVEPWAPKHSGSSQASQGPSFARSRL